MWRRKATSSSPRAWQRSAAGRPRRGTAARGVAQGRSTHVRPDLVFLRRVARRLRRAPAYARDRLRNGPPTPTRAVEYFKLHLLSIDTRRGRTNPEENRLGHPSPAQDSSGGRDRAQRRGHRLQPDCDTGSAGQHCRTARSAAAGAQPALSAESASSFGSVDKARVGSRRRGAALRILDRVRDCVAHRGHHGPRGCQGAYTSATLTGSAGASDASEQASVKGRLCGRVCEPGGGGWGC